MCTPQLLLIIPEVIKGLILLARVFEEVWKVYKPKDKTKDKAKTKPDEK